MSTAIACVDGAGLLAEYLDGVLDAATRDGVDAHLAGCPRCRAFVRSYRATSDIVRRATAVEAPSALGAALRAFLARHR